MDAERRRRTRVPLRISVTVTVGSEDVSVQTWDLSLRGMGCSPDRRFSEGSACRVICSLGAEAVFAIDGRIVRCSEKEAAVFFTGMDEDAFYHLKRLVQYNSSSPDIIDRELADPL